MRIPRIGKTLLAAVLAVVGGLVITGAASADTSKVKFRATAPIEVVAPLAPTVSTFKVDKKGVIKNVKISTPLPGELVATGLLDAECKGGEPATAICAGLNASTVMSVHTSDVKMTDVQVIPHPLGEFVPFPLPDVLSGKIKGDLEGAFSVIAVTGGQMSGSARLKIVGTGVYACFGVTGPDPLAWVPAVIADCQAGFTVLPGGPTLAALFPLALDVSDKGKFVLGEGTGAFEGVKAGKGKVEVQVSVLPGFPPTTSGTMTISKGKLFFETPTAAELDADD